MKNAFSIFLAVLTILSIALLTYDITNAVEATRILGDAIMAGICISGLIASIIL